MNEPRKYSGSFSEQMRQVKEELVNDSDVDNVDAVNFSEEFPGEVSNEDLIKNLESVQIPVSSEEGEQEPKKTFESVKNIEASNDSNIYNSTPVEPKFEEVDSITPELFEEQKQASIQKLKAEIAQAEIEQNEEVVLELENQIRELEKSTLEPETTVQKEKIIAPEYLEAKKAFKEAKAQYFNALEKDYSNRSGVGTFFGIGKSKLSPEAQTAYDNYISANKEFLSQARETGQYDRIVARLNRDKAEGKERESINLPVAERHVLKSVEERIRLQEELLPSGAKSLKKAIMQKPGLKYAAAVAGTGLYVTSVTMKVLNPFAAVAGFAANYAGTKYVEKREEDLKKTHDSIVDSIKTTALDLDELEDAYLQSHYDIDTAKTLRTVGTIGAVAAVGGLDGDSFSGLSESPEINPPVDGVGPDIQPTPDEVEVATVDVESVNESVSTTPDNSEKISATFEKTVTVEKGDTLSQILLDNMRERLTTGQLDGLPSHVNADNLSHYMYQQFPEFTNASGAEQALSPDEWRSLGISSGDPNLIYPGENINVEKLAELMNKGELAPASISDIPNIPNTPDVLPSQMVDFPEGMTEPLANALDTDYAPSGVEEVPVTNSAETAVPVVDSVPTSEVMVEINSTVGKVEIHSEILSDKIPLAVAFEQTGTENISDYMGQYLYEKVQAGELVAPAELSLYSADAVDGFVEKSFPELSRGYLEDRFTGASINVGIGGGHETDIPIFDRGENTLSPAQWRELGIASGNPNEIDVAKDVFNVGKFTEVLFSLDNNGQISPEVFNRIMQTNS